MTDRPKAVPTVQIENERMVVTLWRFAPGAETGWHRHGHDYAVVPLTDGDLLLEEPGGGSRTVALQIGGSYSRPEGVEHNVVNPSTDSDFAFVEIELK
jgi:quercetin dioxygenase-like cupin family protein